jgi:hypothetical protein
VEKKRERRRIFFTLIMKIKTEIITAMNFIVPAFEIKVEMITKSQIIGNECFYQICGHNLVFEILERNKK